MSTLTKNQQRRLRLQNKQKASDGVPVEPAPVEPTPAEPTPAPASDIPIKPANPIITREHVISKAGEMWKIHKEFVKKEPDFKKLTDKEQLDIFRTKLGFGPFMDEFPIVSRYLICTGQYSSVAFNRMLQKTEAMQHPEPSERPKGYMEDQWIRRQADYVQYLWETYQKGHYDNAQRKYVWAEAYKRLRGEFDDFRNMHKDIEERVKEEKKELAVKNTREFLERVASGTQKLSRQEEEYLLYQLQNITYKKMFGNVLKELLVKAKFVEPVHEAMGAGPENIPKITMIETVDVNRMGEVDEQYKPAALRGMEPVIEGDTAGDADDDDGEVIEEIEV